MTKSKAHASLPEWTYHIIIAILFSGLLGVALYVWNNAQADNADELGMITERVSRTNDRQIEMDRRITRIETIMELNGKK